MSFGSVATPKGETVPLWLQLIVICLASLSAAYAGSYLGRVSASSRMLKRVTELETEVAVLTSEYAKVLGLAKKISQRVALDDHRHKRGSVATNSPGEPPPPGDKKAAKAFYLHGKTHQQIARMAQGAPE